MIHLGAAGPPSVERTFRGTWYRSDQPDTSQLGSLTLSPGLPPRLDLDGTLLGENEPRSDVTILGRTGDADDFTLDRAGFRSMHRPWKRRIHGDLTERPPVVSEHWEGWAVAVGSWVPDGSATLVTQLIFRSAMLREWAQSLAPAFEWAEAPRTIGGTITIPEPLVAPIDLGELRLEWTPLGHISTSGADEDLLPQIVIDLAEPQTIEHTWSSIVVPLLHMLTLFVGAGDFVESLLYRTEALEGVDDAYEDGGGTTSYGERLRPRQFEWVTGSWMAKPQTREVPHEFEHLVDAKDIESSFADVVAAWFRVHTKYRGPLFDYLGVHMWESLTIEESFYRVTRSLEVLHGIFDTAPRVPSEEFSEVKRKLKEALEGDPHRDLILARLSHADQPSLKDRLNALVDLCGPRLQNWIPHTRANWIKRVVTTRDQMTHSVGGGPLEGADLYEAYYLLDLIMQTVLLGELGFDITQVDEWVLRTRAARPILYRA